MGRSEETEGGPFLGDGGHVGVESGAPERV